MSAKGVYLSAYLSSEFAQYRFMEAIPDRKEEKRPGIIGWIKDKIYGVRVVDYSGVQIFDKNTLKARIRLHAEKNGLAVEDIIFFNDGGIGCFVKYEAVPNYSKVNLGYV